MNLVDVLDFNQTWRTNIDEELQWRTKERNMEDEEDEDEGVEEEEH
ncbi:hypothetical protein A2U01_0049285, partial [Trifolium medium]|nr:hypothetical protein [Trifolium medium]